MEEQILKCIYCEKELEGRQKKFCCKNCCQKWKYHNNPRERERVLRNAKKWNQRNKDNPILKERKKAYFKKWLSENKEHFKELCREHSKRYQKKRYYKLKEQGLCTSCKGKRDEEDHLTCSNCRKKAIEDAKRRRLNGRET